MRLHFISCLIMLRLSSSALMAQDTRTVTEPVLPPVCTTLTAELTATKGAFASEDEAKLDTVRIQQAIDRCGAGRAVELKANEGKNAFLSGPLELRQGVTLVIDRGATLYASRDPKFYETSPGSCGVVNEERNGCKPLISVKHVVGAGVMGDGTIDGRGGAKLLGKNLTWWDLAEQARASGRQQVPRILVADYADNFTL